MFAVRSTLIPCIVALTASGVAEPVSVARRVVTTEPSVPRDSIFGEPIVVNGHRITDAEIQRRIITGPCRRRLELRLIDALLQHQCRLRAPLEDMPDVEKTRARFEPPRAAAATAYGDWLQRVRDRNPTEDVDAYVRRYSRSESWAVDELRQAEFFDRLMIAENPAEWPAVTREALLEEGGDPTWVQVAEEDFAAKRGVLRGEAIHCPLEDSLMRSQYREIVRSKLERLAAVTRTSDGLLEDTVLEVDVDHDGVLELRLTTDEMWADVESTVTAQEVHDAKLWAVTQRVVADQLEADRLRLTPNERRDVLRRLRAPKAEGQYGNLATYATQVHGFPSVEEYEEYVCARSGFERSLAHRELLKADGSPSSEMTEYLRDVHQPLAETRVDAECLLVSAMDVKHFRPREGGLEGARRRALAIRERVDARNPDARYHPGATLRSETAPTPASAPEQGAEWETSFLGRDPLRAPRVENPDTTNCFNPDPAGHFVGCDRDSISYELGETMATRFLRGGSVADAIVADQPVGTIAGPYRASTGYVLVRVTRRLPVKSDPSRYEVRRADPCEDLVREYSRHEFAAYVHRAMARAAIIGFSREP